MNKDKKKLIIPKLRFPEFWEGWRIVALGKCFTNVGGTALEKYVTTNGTHHFISIGNYSPEGKYIDKGQRVEANDVAKTKLLDKNNLVMVLNDKTLAGDIIGSALLIDEDDKYIYNQRSERLIVGSDLNAIFAWHLLNSPNVRKEVFKRSQGGTQIYVNFPAVKAIKLVFPDLPEQQKIALCLSSIDDLIISQSQKVETLKAYKKGLLQQLLPVDGETIPRLRFPEFRDAGEWGMVQLNQLAIRCKQKNRLNELKRVLTNSAEFGVLDQRDFFDKDIANQSNLDGYYIVEKGDYVYNPRISKTAPVGPISSL
jgi:type I restriction enzyme S subunit